ncbi:hypothetical protein OG799_18085 [Micromonospora sp. NBC_00898]|uniref:hypothetical protein n=1 Tax=Micromonospora sp. NBC_00898 TaxID=2975981 RepID=UPI00386A6585|nr:hypothetical protein OG799_18085 [Micromonospora sp. NBC_00898]
MSGQDWTEVIGAIGLFALVIAVVTTIIVQVARTFRARAVLAHEGEFRKLSETAVQTQQGIEHQLTEVAGRLAAIESRMDSMEHVLRTVE